MSAVEPQTRILVVDDEPNIRRALSMILEAKGYGVRTCESAEDALVALHDEPAEMMLLDLMLPGMGGAQLLEQVHDQYPAMQVVMISGHGSIEDAVNAMQRGAADFLEKPLEKARVLGVLERLHRQRALQAENRRLRRMLGEEEEMLGESESIQSLREQIGKVAPTEGRVLILGESGVGKELVAKSLHRQSPRTRAPLVKLNCAAIPSELIEAELFGHVKGAFTGALRDREGKFEQAHKGTLFLDEIGDMSLEAQAKVLRALQAQEVTRVGGNQSIPVDIRLITATNRDLELMVANGEFREDLFFRIHVVPLRVPPLRERLEDLRLLVDTFINSNCERYEMPVKAVDEGVYELLHKYHWPGNVRELKNMVERMVIMSGPRIEVTDVPAEIVNNSHVHLSPDEPLTTKTMPLKEWRNEAERAYLSRILRECGGNVSQAARVLEVERTNLHKKLKALGLRGEE